MNHAINTLAELRADLPITRNFIYLQTGTYAPVPNSTQRMMEQTLREENEHFITLGGKGAATAFYQQIEAARQTIADLVNVNAGEVAWSYNTTTATRLAVQSIHWQAGDKLAITDVEHASTMTLARGLEQTRGVTTTVIQTGDGPTYTPDRLLEELDRNLTPDHRLLILCHVANTDGRRLPVAEAVQIARARGVKTLIDGAQAVGVFPVDVAAIGADFYSGSGHKWLMGPAGVGFLVVHTDALADYNPNFVPTKPGEVLTASALSELGTPNHVSRLGTAYSIAMLQRIGLDQIEQQVKRLTQQLREGLRTIPGIQNAGPDAWALSSGITTLQLENGSLERIQQLVEILRQDYQIVTKVRPEVTGVRISVAAFNVEEEVDRLLDALAKIVPTL